MAGMAGIEVLAKAVLRSGIGAARKHAFPRKQNRGDQFPAAITNLAGHSAGINKVSAVADGADLVELDALAVQAGRAKDANQI